MDTLARYQGSLLGLAVGDALGVALEFHAPGSFAPIEDMVGGGTFQLKPGEWTDDTSMALCLAESLAECRDFDPSDQLDRYLRWYREGHLSSIGRCFDIGNTTLAAIQEFERTRQPYCGQKCTHSAGNGSIMRLAPIPLFYSACIREAAEKSAASSKTTHGTRVAVDACRYLGVLIWGAVNDLTKEELLAEPFRPEIWRQQALHPVIAEIAEGSYKHKNPPEIVAGGYAASTLEAALWAFFNSDSFRDGALMAVNLGDDADTVGAVYGQLAGAFYGVGGIPDNWIGKLVQGDLIREYANRLFTLAQERKAKL